MAMGILGLSALALVIGRLRRTSKELHRRVGEQTATSARLAGLHEINVAVASTLDLNGVLTTLLEKIDRLLPYAASTVRLLNKESGLLEPVAGRNLDVEEWKREHWIGSRGVTSLALKNKEPVMVKND